MSGNDGGFFYLLRVELMMAVCARKILIVSMMLRSQANCDLGFRAHEGTDGGMRCIRRRHERN